MPGTKLCNCCGREKATRHFHRDASRPDGLTSRCGQCRRAACAASARKRRKAKAAYRAEYEALRPGAEAERRRERRDAMTPEERRELWRYEYQQRDKAKINARLREKRRAA